MTKNVLKTKIGKVENKIPDNSKYITTQKINKSVAENSPTRLKQHDLLKKNWFW